MLWMIFIRPSFDGRILVWRCPSVRMSVRRYVASYTILVGRIMQELCDSNLVCTLHMQRGVKPSYFQGQISSSLSLYKEPWHYDPCWHDIVITMQSRLLKLSMYTSYGKRKKPIFSRSKVKFQRH